jgi:hypothetical protein
MDKRVHKGNEALHSTKDLHSLFVARRNLERNGQRLELP